MRILVTGASGMMGSGTALQLSEFHEVFATGNSVQLTPHFTNYKAFDLAKEDYSELIEWSNPEIIIHCAALTNGNYCSEHPMEAMIINGLTLKKLLAFTNSNVKIIFISTDAVFPGYLNKASESDCVNPESVYGKSKELGEFFLRLSNRNYCIIRTTIVGLNIVNNRQGFVEWILNSLKKEEEIGLFEDVIFNPISIWSLTKEIAEVIIPQNVRGIYHISGSEVSSKYAFGLKLAQTFDLDIKYIKKSSILSFAERAKRSTDQTLAIDGYCQKFVRALPDIKQTINELKNYYEKYTIRKEDC